MTRVTTSPSTTAARIWAICSGPHGLAQQQRLGLGGQDQGDQHQQRADAHRADAVPDTVAGGEGEADAAQREHQTDQCAEVLQQDDRQLGGLGAAYELGPGLLAAQLVGLLDRRTEGEALGDDREDQDADRPVPVVQLVRLVDLLVALVEREDATDGEQDDGDEEAVDVALAAVSEGVLGGRRALGLLASEQQQALVAGVRDGVHTFGQHRGRTTEGERHELRCGNRQVGAQRRNDRLCPA